MAERPRSQRNTVRAPDSTAANRRPPVGGGSVAPVPEAAAGGTTMPAKPTADDSAMPLASEAATESPDRTFFRRVIVERIAPQIDHGRFPIKRTIGEVVDVSADVFADGHDALVVILRDRSARPSKPQTARPAAPDPLRRADDAPAAMPLRGAVPVREGWRETPMALVAPGTDRYAGQFIVHDLGWHEYSIIAWADRFQSWRRDLRVKADAGQDVSVDLLEGSLLVREAAARAPGADAEWLLAQSAAVDGTAPLPERIDAATNEDLAALMLHYADRSQATTSAVLRVWVDRERARFGSWYEMFPRSAGPDPARSATFQEACRRLSAIADMGFDVLYLPPIHPIGRSFRKGPNNSLDGTAGRSRQPMGDRIGSGRTHGD